MHIHMYHKTHICTLIYERCAYIYTRYTNVILSVFVNAIWKYEHNCTCTFAIEIHTQTHTHTGPGDLRSRRCSNYAARFAGADAMAERWMLRRFSRKRLCRWSVFEFFEFFDFFRSKVCQAGGCQGSVMVLVCIFSYFRVFVHTLHVCWSIIALMLCVCMHVIHLHACVCDVCMCVCVKMQRQHTHRSDWRSVEMTGGAIKSAYLQRAGV
jgi:hypothetical protein